MNKAQRKAYTLEFTGAWFGFDVSSLDNVKGLLNWVSPDFGNVTTLLNWDKAAITEGRKRNRFGGGGRKIASMMHNSHEASTLYSLSWIGGEPTGSESTQITNPQTRQGKYNKHNSIEVALESPHT